MCVCACGDDDGRTLARQPSKQLTKPTHHRIDTVQVVEFLKLYDAEPMTKIEKVGG